MIFTPSGTRTLFLEVCQRLRTDTSGAIAPMFGLAVVVLLGTIGMSVDYARAARVKARVAAAADAANLAAAKAAATYAADASNPTEAEINAEATSVAKKYFAANVGTMPDAAVSPPDLQVTHENGVWKSHLQYSAQLPPSLIKVFGAGELAITGTSEASVAPSFPVLDIAMCVDSTGSMTPTLDAVKNNAAGLYSNLNAEMTARGITPFPLVRVRVMYFKDFGDSTPGTWDPDPLVISPYFTLPDQSSNFSAFVSPQVAYGGWDTPESGMECLNEAISSQWLKAGQVPAGFTDKISDVYPLIVVWTDAPSHPLPFPNSLANPDYPPSSKMPRDFASMLNKWNDPTVIDQANRQILFFGDPDVTAIDQYGYASGWQEVKTWPKFAVGGSLLDANASTVEFLADGIARMTSSVRVTQ